jgi:hypothetical protein
MRSTCPSPEAAFDLLVDFSRLPEWDGRRGARRLDSGPIARAAASAW